MEEGNQRSWKEKNFELNEDEKGEEEEREEGEKGEGRGTRERENGWNVRFKGWNR